MQNIRINDKIFRSMTKAAKFLGIPTVTLSEKMRNKQAITHKDLLIEKIKPEPKVKHRRRARTVPVLVDGVAYNSIMDAETTLNFPRGVLSGALSAGQKFYKEHKIEYVYPSDAGRRNHNVKKIPVYCKNLDRKFDSILEAAAFAGVDSWTMSKKMEFSGGFIDSAGNEYVRLKPMKTKNVYKTTSKTLDRIVPEYTRTVKPKDEQQLPPVPQKPQVPDVVVEAIQEKIKRIIEDSPIHDQITELMKYAGLKKIIFTMPEND